MIECVPTASDEVVNVATRLESEPEPSEALPSRKFIVPVGVPEAALTVAVKVTELCKTAGLLFEVTAVVVVVRLTVTCTTVSEETWLAV